MKKSKTILLFLFLLLAAEGTVRAQSQSFHPYESGLLVYHGYQFPIVPGSEEWKALGHLQRVASLQIPLDTLNQMSTARLLETCLYYPFNVDIIAYDNHLAGYDRMKNQFNGYLELLNRQDFIQCLVSLYNNREIALVNQMTDDYEKGRYSFDFQMMEYLFTDAALLASPNQTEQIISLLVQKLDQKSHYSSIFSSVSLPITTIAIGRCLQQGYGLSDYQGNTLDAFLQDGTIIKTSDIRYLLEKARNINDIKNN